MLPYIDFNVSYMDQERKTIASLNTQFILKIHICISFLNGKQTKQHTGPEHYVCVRKKMVEIW